MIHNDQDIDANQIDAIYKQTQKEFSRLLRTRAEQVLKWGRDDEKPLLLLLAVLGEEVGETCAAILGGINDSLEASHAREEALQTAAVALAIAEQMTKTIEKFRE